MYATWAAHSTNVRGVPQSQYPDIPSFECGTGVHGLLMTALLSVFRAGLGQSYVKVSGSRVFATRALRLAQKLARAKNDCLCVRAGPSEAGSSRFTRASARMAIAPLRLFGGSLPSGHSTRRLLVLCRPDQRDMCLFGQGHKNVGKGRRICFPQDRTRTSKLRPSSP